MAIPVVNKLQAWGDVLHTLCKAETTDGTWLSLKALLMVEMNKKPLGNTLFKENTMGQWPSYEKF
jgi:hypothetical protein